MPGAQRVQQATGYTQMLGRMRIPTLVPLTITTCSAAWSDGTDRTRVAVVFGSHSCRQATADEAALVRVFADSVTADLDAVGIAHDNLRVLSSLGSASR